MKIHVNDLIIDLVSFCAAMTGSDLDNVGGWSWTEPSKWNSFLCDT